MNSLIPKYISDLLYLHYCVIVPGFGGFVANYRNIVIIEDKNIFIPPDKEVGFNRILSYNDGLLANFIAKKESISYLEALKKIDLFVNDLKTKLLQGNEINLANIGTLKKDDIGNFIFSPNEETSFLPESLGLTTFRFVELSKKNQAKNNFQDEQIKTIKKHSLRNWVAAAAVILCFFVFSIDLKMPNISQAGFVTEFFGLADETVQISENDEFSEATDNQILEIDEIDNKTIITKKYHIIVGSFNYNSQAVKAVNQFKSEGFSDVTVIDGGNNRFRISLFSFSEKNEASIELEKLRKQPQFETAWLLKN